VRQTLQAMSIVWPTLVTIAFANIVNVIANYGLIFGHFGLPRLEVVGSAIATSTSRWVMFVGLALTALPMLRRYLGGVPWSEFRPRRFVKFLQLGAPVGLQISLEMWAFAAVALIMGSLGAVELAGHQIALTLAALTFMVPLGIAGAAATRVGNAIGRGDQEGARRAASVSLWIGATVMLAFGLCFWRFPGFLSRLFTSHSEVIDVVAILLPIAAVFQVADGTQVVGAGVLRGTADTRFPAAIAFLGYWVFGLPVGVLLAYRFDWGPAGLWWGLTVGLTSVAGLLLLRIRARFGSVIDRLGDD